jgi:sterol desaturase/sphingolipid hydroxylase (fatty acid hydroxylase superfamily)
VNRVLPYFWYPAFLSLAVASFFAMLAAGAPPAAASFIPAIIVGISIFFLERRFPEREEWWPTRADLAADAAFMGVVMVVLPRLLSLLAVVAIASWRHAEGANALWPHEWPLAAQILLMVIAVDFVRYWLHRACHRFEPLWRLHEVHHSPDLLYVVNVGRFHPLEKALHFTLDTVPFLILGVAPEVMAGYFLVYSINGFFQHSNLKLRYGWLNYVVGSAETHRWHHARDPKLAACNFGNTTIVWDLAFGTWRLPGAVGDIGIANRGYPKGFLAQLATPFRRREPRRSVRAWIADRLVKLRLRVTGRVALHRLALDARNPMRVQRELLADLVRENRSTTFGVRHRFGEIRDYATFARNVPVSEFEALRPYVDAEIASGERALTIESPVRYVRTSGTTGIPKDIPLTASHLGRLRRIHQRSVAFQHRAAPDAFAGGILAFVSPAFEGTLANGKPYGSASGIVAGNTPSYVLEKFVLPPEALAIEDSHVKYLLALRLAAARRDVTYLGAANPSTILALAKLYREHRAAIIQDIERGSFFLAGCVPAPILRAIESRLRADPARSRELRSLPAAARLADVWPDLRLVVTWTCASAGIAASAMRRELAVGTRVLELGYVSSEFRGTITVGRRRGSGAPTIDTHFFEFAERERWDQGERELLTLDRVKRGVEYYLVITTPSGLYRYFINDVVRVTGFLGQLPLLRFVQKGKGVTNITGEKVCEAQVLDAVRRATAMTGRHARFAMALADEEAAVYRLYVELDERPLPPAREIAAIVDGELARTNIEYAAKRESGRLAPLEVHWLEPDTGERFKAHCVARGQREGQFKMVALDYRRRFDFDLSPYLEEAA